METLTAQTPEAADQQARQLAAANRDFVRRYVGTRLYRALRRRGVPAELCARVTLYARS